jgi:hypothetical protein
MLETTAPDEFYRVVGKGVKGSQAVPHVLVDRTKGDTKMAGEGIVNIDDLAIENVPEKPTPERGRESIGDLQSFPVLTEEVSAGGPASTTRPASSGFSGATSPLRAVADRAIREVLSWRTKNADPKGFVGALTQAFDLKQVEGHTEWTWTPRSYTVQTDIGAVIGAQASIYTRAKVALDKSLPLLDGLYALIPYVEQEGLAMPRKLSFAHSSQRS